MSSLDHAISDDQCPNAEDTRDGSEHVMGTSTSGDTKIYDPMIPSHPPPPSPTPSSSDSDSSFFAFGNDRAADLWRRRGGSKPVTAIFIHAGAGYHSISNEQIHLEACSEAARAAMKQLRRGKTAIEAVEEAVKVLEDKEITNAGYGSNLSIDGTVECDATVVDHLGRSGACGAVPNIKNPVSLAKAILEKSHEPLSLRRVPPNLLVGEGARQFGVEHGITAVSNDRLISRNARDRFARWHEDLKRAENHGTDTPLPPIITGQSTSTVMSGESSGSASLQRDHASAILMGTWNEGQPDSPGYDSPGDRGTVTTKSSLPSPSRSTTKSPLWVSPERSALNLLNSPLSSSTLSSSKVSSTRSRHPPPAKRLRTVDGPDNSPAPYVPEFTNGTVGSHGHGYASEHLAGNTCKELPPSCSGKLSADVSHTYLPEDPAEFDNDDNITDTVGAIAIDSQGNIAAGSSSGGIGMKHRGRIGPAALVGIGTAVIPQHVQDQEHATVATVTSGTGEHMATAQAAQKCAERLYQGRVRGPAGMDVEEPDEGAIVRSFIERDFLDHPGVRHSTSAPAIGVMAVRKTIWGYYLYFAHNTDSFALASMGSGDREPSCVMSRVPEGGKNIIAQGARKISSL